jgi:hypothetical protein
MRSIDHLIHFRIPVINFKTYSHSLDFVEFSIKIYPLMEWGPGSAQDPLSPGMESFRTYERSSLLHIYEIHWA